ncbi:hypothetical protein PILCRDRAFT_821669 [Piloderma croceum F 1598]|uniref:Uncharacterized protein n=1 Tax=Piloderma croceum (strain F 1598) TaxID=765440 RepID=A0A0C3FPW0_PILCF|nr:hypothetical protein PILCRDRAFT_821669 [Piloderma croceum F 1598]
MATSGMVKQLVGVKGHLPRLQSLSIDQYPLWLQPLEAFQFAPWLRCLAVGPRLAADDIKLLWHSLMKVVMRITSSNCAM